MPRNKYEPKNPMIKVKFHQGNIVTDQSGILKIEKKFYEKNVFKRK